MITTFASAIVALSCTTGGKLTSNVALSKENIQMVSLVSNREIVDEVIKGLRSVNDLYAASGANLYSLFIFNDDTYVVIDKPLDRVIEIGNVLDSPYKTFTSDTICVINNNQHYIYDKDNNWFKSFETNQLLTSECTSLKYDVNYTYTPCKSSNYPNVTAISNAYYFDNLNGRYGLNNTGICGVVAAQILLCYHDTFDNDVIVQENFDKEGVYNGISTSLSSWSQSPATDNYLSSSTSSFRDYLINKSNDVNNRDPNGGMYDYEINRLIDAQLDDSNINADVNFYPFHTNKHTKIKDIIDDDRPAIITLPNHFVVVYGYDDNYYYTDTGWGFTARFSQSEFDYTGASFGIIDIEVNNHVHSNNYFNGTTHQLLCGCGIQHSKRLVMDPSDWDFEEQYYFYVKNKNHTKDGISFTSQRYRTGYIQSTVINLSPRRNGAGNARFDIVLPYEMYRVKANMAWWSSNENQNDGNAQIMYHELEDDETFWTTNYINLHSLNMNTSYTNLTEYTFSMPTDCNGIRFYLTNIATGDWNRGRLSLGKIQIDYYD